MYRICLKQSEDQTVWRRNGSEHSRKTHRTFGSEVSTTAELLLGKTEKTTHNFPHKK